MFSAELVNRFPSKKAVEAAGIPRALKFCSGFRTFSILRSERNLAYSVSKDHSANFIMI